MISILQKQMIDQEKNIYFQYLFEKKLKKNRKSISSVIATSLLLVIVIILIINFQTWFVTYSSTIQTDIEVKSNLGNSNDLRIENLIGNILYIINNIEDNIYIHELKIGGIECLLNTNLSLGMNSLNVSDCIENVTTSTPDIVLITEYNILMKKVYIDDINIANTVEVPNPSSLSSFTTIWDVDIDTGSSGFNNLTLPLQSNGTYNFVVDWGDGSSDTITSWDQTEKTHNYIGVTDGIYTLNITGTIEGFAFNGGPYSDNLHDGDKLLNITQWGPLRFGNNGEYFSNCEHFSINAINAPNLTGMTTLSHAFALSGFNGDLNNWDTSSIIFMDNVFFMANSFNGDVSNWDTSSATTMTGMFFDTYVFNKNISGWDVSSVTDMSMILNGAEVFNYSLRNWDVSSVTDMYGLFSGAEVFNGDISEWDVSSVTDMRRLFRGSDAFNQDISNWDTSSVLTMKEMFEYSMSFNQPLNNWNVSSVTDMTEMFRDSIVFNQPLNSWDVSNVTTMYYMFEDAVFDQNLSSWDVSNVITMDCMFMNSIFDQDLRDWCVTKIGSEPPGFAINSPLNTNGMKPIWGTCP